MPLIADSPGNLAQEIDGSILATCNSCRMESSIQNVLQHVEACGEVMVGCNNKGCNIPVKRKDKVENSTVCPKERINCSICRRLMERGQFDWHCECECIGRQVGCSPMIKEMIKYPMIKYPMIKEIIHKPWTSASCTAMKQDAVLISLVLSGALTCNVVAHNSICRLIISSYDMPNCKLKCLECN